MKERFPVVIGRTRQELDNLERIVARAARAIEVADRRPDEQDLYVDSAVLNLHDFYAGLERIFREIATVIDQSLPATRVAS